MALRQWSATSRLVLERELHAVRGVGDRGLPLGEVEELREVAAREERHFFFPYSRKSMVLHRQTSQGFGAKVMSAAATGMKYAATAKAIYDVGQQVANVARVAGPMLAAVL